MLGDEMWVNRKLTINWQNFAQVRLQPKFALRIRQGWKKPLVFKSKNLSHLFFLDFIVFWAFLIWSHILLFLKF